MIQLRTTVLLVLLAISFSGNAQEFKFGKVSEEELKETFNPRDSSATATVLYRSKDIRFNYIQGAGFSVVTEVFERIKIYDKAGFDYATVSQSLYRNNNDIETVSGLKAYTHTLKNGKIEKSKMEKSAIFTTELNKYRNEEKFTLPNVKEGCVIEYQYRITSPFYYSIDEIALQYDIPIKQQEISISAPEYFVFKPNMKGYLAVNPKYSTKSDKINFTNKSRTTSGGGWGVTSTEYSGQSIDYKVNITNYNMTNIPALKEEPFVNAMNNYRSSVNYELQYVKFPQQLQENYTTTWEDVIKKIYESDNFGGQLKSTRYFKDELEVLRGETSTETELMGAIFSHVQGRMNWNNIYGYYVDKGVKTAYKEQSGNIADINLMLTAMLQEAGLSASPVLVSTRSHGVPMSPTREGFNYVIASVEIDGNLILLDATNKYTRPNLLPTRALNWFGRKIQKDGSIVLVDLFPKNLSEESVQLSINLKENGSIEGKVRHSNRDYNAYLFRNKYANSVEDDYLEKLENKNNGMEISDYSIKNKGSMGKPVLESYSFSLDNQADVVGDKIYFSPLFHLAMNENPFKLEKREYPIDFSFPWREKYTVNIAIPEGYKITSLPESANMTMVDNIGGFQYQVLDNGTAVQLRVDVKINQAVIAASYYNGLKELFKNIVEKQTEKVVLSKITSNGTTESSGKGR
ncbi:DUF3857 domain-containing protein [Zobellia barbeyronii]|uniref:DUF3857 domain-containing protein n=1 Tax=Zobellia barbeyronii TaxID=2748009 RepID=A0ABS5WF41_9FLAO|nr:DUF3857 domain-containing protein [Zobellia barbeyronii]MBT2161985.1 DUF3857 domain-containing protein [Zobellia barbeyronii]